MKTANEIALEAQVETMRKQILEHETWEMQVSMAFSKMLMGTLTNSSDFVAKSFEELKDLIKDKALKNVQKMAKEKF